MKSSSNNQRMQAKELAELAALCMALHDVTRPSLGTARHSVETTKRYLRLCLEGERFYPGCGASLLAAIANAAEPTTCRSSRSVSIPPSAHSPLPPKHASSIGEIHMGSPSDDVSTHLKLGRLYFQFAVAVAALIGEDGGRSIQDALRTIDEHAHLGKMIEAAIKGIDYDRFRRAQNYWRTCIQRTSTTSHSESKSHSECYAGVLGLHNPSTDDLESDLTPYDSIVESARSLERSAVAIRDSHAAGVRETHESINSIMERATEADLKVDRIADKEEAALEKFYGDYSAKRSSQEDEEDSIHDGNANRGRRNTGTQHSSAKSRSERSAGGMKWTGDNIRVAGKVASIGLSIAMDVADSSKDDLIEEVVHAVVHEILEHALDAAIAVALDVTTPGLGRIYRGGRLLAKALS